MKTKRKHSEKESGRRSRSLVDADDLARAEGEGMIAERVYVPVAPEGAIAGLFKRVRTRARDLSTTMRRKLRQAFARETPGAEATDASPNQHEHRRRDTVPMP